MATFPYIISVLSKGWNLIPFLVHRDCSGTLGPWLLSYEGSASSSVCSIPTLALETGSSFLHYSHQHRASTSPTQVSVWLRG